MSEAATKYAAYTRVNVETASQGKLVEMLFNGAIKRAEEAKRQLDRGKNDTVHNNLIRAQDIISELRGALNMDTGPIAAEIDRLYEYFLHLLVTANIRKSSEPIDECVQLMTEMRDTWREAFLLADQESTAPAAARPASHHGASLLNLQG